MSTNVAASPNPVGSPSGQEPYEDNYAGMSVCVKILLKAGSIALASLSIFLSFFGFLGVNCIIASIILM
jgi:hypothetical protein